MTLYHDIYHDTNISSSYHYLAIPSGNKPFHLILYIVFNVYTIYLLRC